MLKGAEFRFVFLVGLLFLAGMYSGLVRADRIKDIAQVQGVRDNQLTGSCLAIATLVAIFLNLIFRLGNRRTASLTVEGDEQSWAQMEGFLQSQGKIWELRPEMLALACQSAQKAWDMIFDHRLSQGPVTLDLAFDDPELRLEISYHGDPLNPPEIGPMPTEVRGKIPFSEELSGSWRCFCHDASVCILKGGDCRITLIF